MKRLTRTLLFTCLILLATALTARNSQAAPGTEYLPSARDMSAEQLLVQARTSLADLAAPAGSMNDIDVEVAFGTAIEALTSLYELHGCEWALPALLELRGRPGCPDSHLGWSADGRLCLRLERLALQNPAYDNYTILLCVLSSNTPTTLDGELKLPLLVKLTDGTSELAQPVNEQHPLWQQLRNLAPTFEPQGSLTPGLALSFKQLFAIPNLRPADISRVELAWGDYEVVVPYYENGLPQ